jgi:hypothetical protein
MSRFDLNTFVHIDLHRAERAEQRVANLRPVPRKTMHHYVERATRAAMAKRDALRAAQEVAA